MIALKKIILAFALLAVMFCITGCDENFDEPVRVMMDLSVNR